ncbi:MAG: MarR family transcriptional regulator [Candidatus Margulisiibacteriota bacterium]
MIEKNVRTVIDEFERLMQTVSRTFHRAGLAFLSGMEITIQQFMLMNCVYHKECPKMKELADELKVTMGNITSMVDRLIEHGYLARKDDPDDRRVVRVCLTVKAKEIIKKAIEERRNNMAMLLDKITGEDRSSLIRIMGKMVTAINNMKGEMAE